MSIDSAKAFIERVENDEDFRKELKGMASAEERMKSAGDGDYTKPHSRLIVVS